MGKEDKDKFIKEVLKKNEVVWDKRDEIFRTQPDNPIAALKNASDLADEIIGDVMKKDGNVVSLENKKK
jgi:hypothetical protein